MTDINELCAQLDHLSENVIQDEASRKKLMEAAHNLSLALEKPGDTVRRIVYTVSGLEMSNYVGSELTYCPFTAPTAYCMSNSQRLEAF